MAKRIDTAAVTKVALEDGRDVEVQELSYFGTMKALKAIRKIIAKSKEIGSLDALLKSFREAEQGEGQNIDRVLDAMNMVLGVVGDEPELLPELLSMCVVGDWTAETVGALPACDVIELAKAVYQVNWVDGSLKKALGKFVKFEETPEESPNLRTLPSTPSETPEAEKTSIPAEASTS